MERGGRKGVRCSFIWLILFRTGMCFLSGRYLKLSLLEHFLGFFGDCSAWLLYLMRFCLKFLCPGNGLTSLLLSFSPWFSAFHCHVHFLSLLESSCPYGWQCWARSLQVHQAVSHMSSHLVRAILRRQADTSVKAPLLPSADKLTRNLLIFRFLKHILISVHHVQQL